MNVTRHDQVTIKKDELSVMLQELYEVYGNQLSSYFSDLQGTVPPPIRPLCDQRYASSKIERKRS